MKFVFGIKLINNANLNLVKIIINLRIKNVLIIYHLVLNPNFNVDKKYVRIINYIMMKIVENKISYVHPMADFVYKEELVNKVIMNKLAI